MKKTSRKRALSLFSGGRNATDCVGTTVHLPPKLMQTKMSQVRGSNLYKRLCQGYAAIRGFLHVRVQERDANR